MTTAEVMERGAAWLDELATIDFDALPAGALDDVVTGLHRLLHRVDAQDCRAVHVWEQRRVWDSDGSRSAASRLARDGHCSLNAARRTLSRGDAFDAMPAVASAFAAGDISGDQVDLLAVSRASRESLFERDEEVLAEQARTLRFAELVKAQRYWRERADAELDRDGMAPSTTPSVTLSDVGDLVAINGQLDSIGGAAVTSALDKIADELAPAHPGVPRAQLRAIALEEMARRAMAMPADGRPARTLVNIVCGVEAFDRLCELSNGTVIRPGELIPHLDTVDIRTIVFGSPIRAIGASPQRSFTGALRAAIQVRDRHCQHPSGCDEPIDSCDVDHIIPSAFGGITGQDNGRLLCVFHNRIEPQLARPPTATTAVR